jgi:UDP-glucose 4-epimerase
MGNSLVTGGAGFIGSHLAAALLERGDAVRILDNFSTGLHGNILEFQDRVDLIEGDLCDPNDLVSSLIDIDLVFHQAAFVSGPLSLIHPEKCFESNVIGTVRLLTNAAKAGVKRVVLASSAAVYGKNPAIPLTEEAEVQPLTPYAVTKVVGELYTKLFSSISDLEVVALRYFNVYGPRQNPHSDYAAVIPIFIKDVLGGKQPVIFGDGLQSRDFIYVGDVVRANLLAAETGLVPGRVINICSGRETNLLELIDILGSLFENQLEPSFEKERPGDIYRSTGSPSLAKDLLLFEPQVDFKQGLDKTVNWIAQT